MAGFPVVRDISLRQGELALEGMLSVPVNATGLVAFAHGSGSSRHSPRNRFVAEVLHGAGIGTLLFDLLTDEESRDRSVVFDIPLLTERLLLAADWAAAELAFMDLPFGVFGASTGAAAALTAAAERPTQIAAVVSRGGRPDLAEPDLGRVRAPTLLIVGAEDHEVVRLNRRAFALLHCPKHIVIVPGATHLFEEPGTLELAARHAAEWFHTHLAVRADPVTSGF